MRSDFPSAKAALHLVDPTAALTRMTFVHLFLLGVVGTGISTAVFVWNFMRSRKRGTIAGPNPWHAPTLEWSIPSPPPEYNFAKIPHVHSRYPLWDRRATDEDHRGLPQAGGERRRRLFEPLVHARLL
jgi:heme/copper-type cytochrome/quinol oxidase subunit 1